MEGSPWSGLSLLFWAAGLGGVGFFCAVLLLQEQQQLAWIDLFALAAVKALEQLADDRLLLLDQGPKLLHLGPQLHHFLFECLDARLTSKGRA